MPFKFGTHIGCGQFLPPDHKLAPKWAWPGVRDSISKFWDPINISQTEKATIFKFGTHIGRGQFLPPDHKLSPKWAWPGVCDPISKFWDPLNISQTEKATIFQFGTHIGRGQFFPPAYVRAKLGPMVSRGGGVLWRPPSRTACYNSTLIPSLFNILH